MDADFKEYKIDLHEFAELTGTTNKGEYKRLRQITKNMMGQVIEVPVDKEYLQVGVFSSVRYKPEANVAVVRFDPNLKPFLLQLKRYTKFYFEEVVRLKSPYTVRLWTMLMQYALVGERTVALETLYEIFKVPPSYTVYGTFKRRVLDPAKKECEETSLRFNYEEIKQSRAVSALKFTITIVGDEALDAPPAKLAVSSVVSVEADYEDAIEHDLIHLFSLDPTVVAQLMAVHERDYLGEKILLAKQQQREGKLSNPPGYLLAAIKNDYKSYSLRVAACERPPEREDDKAETRATEEAQAEAYKEYQRVLDDALGFTLCDASLTEVLEDFEAYLEREERFYLSQAKREVTDRGEAFDLTTHYRLPILYGVFRRFMAKSHLPPYYRSFDAWLAHQNPE